MPEPIPMTAQELERLRAELERLKTEGRRRTREELRRARSFGDFRENAEFEEAKRTQATLEGRIAELENVIGRAQVIEGAAADCVAVGALVVASDMETHEEMRFSLRAPGTEGPDAIPVTPDSPIGRSLMGKRPGELVEVETPSGTRRYQVMSVSFGSDQAGAPPDTGGDSAPLRS